MCEQKKQPKPEQPPPPQKGKKPKKPPKYVLHNLKDPCFRESRLC